MSVPPLCVFFYKHLILKLAYSTHAYAGHLGHKPCRGSSLNLPRSMWLEKALSAVVSVLPGPAWHIEALVGVGFILWTLAGSLGPEQVGETLAWRKMNLLRYDPLPLPKEAGQQIGKCVTMVAAPFASHSTMAPLWPGSLGFLHQLPGHGALSSCCPRWIPHCQEPTFQTLVSGS